MSGRRSLAPTAALLNRVRETEAPMTVTTFRRHLTCLSLTEPVAKAVRRDDIEHLPRDAVALFDVER
jgi:hypothetical protein